MFIVLIESGAPSEAGGRTILGIRLEKGLRQSIRTLGSSIACWGPFLLLACFMLGLLAAKITAVE